MITNGSPPPPPVSTRAEHQIAKNIVGCFIPTAADVHRDELCLSIATAIREAEERGAAREREENGGLMAVMVAACRQLAKIQEGHHAEARVRAHPKRAATARCYCGVCRIDISDEAIAAAVRAPVQTETDGAREGGEGR